MRARTWVVGLVVALGAGAPAAARADEPTGALQDSAHTSSVEDPSLAGAWRVRWRIHPDGDVADGPQAHVSQVLVTGGRAFVWSSAYDGSSGGVVAYDVATGGRLWTGLANAGLEPGDGLSRLAAGDGRLYAVSRFGRMVAFDQATGARAWGPTPETEQHSYSKPPTYAAGRLFVSGAGHGATVYAYDARDGRALWQQDVEGGDSTPAVDPSGVYVHYPVGRTYAFDADGHLRWQVGSGSGGGGADPVVSDGQVLTYDDYYEQVQVLSAADGSPVATLPIKAPALAVDHDLAVGRDSDTGTLTAYRRPGFATAWTSGQTGPFGGSVLTDPLLVDGRTVVSTSDGRLRALDPADGHPTADVDLGAVPQNGTVDGPLVVAGDGIIVARAYDGDLVAVEGVPGSIPAPGTGTTPATGTGPAPATTTPATTTPAATTQATSPTDPNTPTAPAPAPGPTTSVPALTAPTPTRLPPAAASIRLLTARRIAAVRGGVRLDVRAPRPSARVAVELLVGTRIAARRSARVAAGTTRVVLPRARVGAGRRALRITVTAPGCTSVRRTYRLAG